MKQNMVGARTLAHLRGERDLAAERERLAELRRRAKGSGLVFWLCNPQKRRVRRFWQVVSLLQENSRMTLTEMSKRLDVPISALFDLVKEVEKFFRFTVVLRDGERDRITKNLPAEFEFSCGFTAGQEPEIPLLDVHLSLILKSVGALVTQEADFLEPIHAPQGSKPRYPAGFPHRHPLVAGDQLDPIALIDPACPAARICLRRAPSGARTASPIAGPR